MSAPHQRIYRIRSGRVWYNGRHGWCRDEHDSPIFTNRLRAESKIRSGLKVSRELSETRPDLPWEVDNHAKWSAAAIAEYEMVPLQENTP
jgi:hypothetical protein